MPPLPTLLLCATLILPALAADLPGLVFQTLPPDAAPPLVTRVRHAALLPADREQTRSPGTVGHCFLTTPSAPHATILESGGGILVQNTHGVLFSLWIKAEGPSALPDDSRASLSLKSEGGARKYLPLASVPLRKDAWTRLAAWVPPGGPSTLILQLPAHTPCLIDSPRAWVAPTGPPSDPRAPLRIEGPRLLAGTAPILLNGVNLSAYSDDENAATGHPMACSDEDDYRMISMAGFNCVRLNLWHKCFADPGGWEWLDLHLTWAAAHGLRVLLDLHAPPGGYQGPTYKSKAFYKSESLQNAAIDFWTAAAARYSKSPTVAAFDLINEPCPARDEHWQAWVRKAVPRIRAAGWTGPLIVEKSFAEDSAFEKLEDPAILYDAHFYEPWSFCSGKGGTYGGPLGPDSPPPGLLDKSYLERALRDELLDFAQKHRVPVNIGEYGVLGSMIPHGGDRWLRDLRALLDHHGIHRQYWCWHSYPFALHDPHWHRTDPPQSSPALLEIAAKP